MNKRTGNRAGIQGQETGQEYKDIKQGRNTRTGNMGQEKRTERRAGIKGQETGQEYNVTML